MAPEHIKADWPGTAWIAELAQAWRQAVQSAVPYLASLRSTPEALPRLIRERWSIESWHRIRDTQLHEHKNCNRGNEAGVLAAPRTAGLNLLRLAEFDSTREGLQTVRHDRHHGDARVAEKPARDLESALRGQAKPYQQRSARP